MIQQQIDRYMALTQRVQELPSSIADAEQNLSEGKRALGRETKVLEEIGKQVVDDAILKAGGIKEFGSSDDIRKMRAKEVKSQSRRYVEQERIVETCQMAVERQQDLVNDLNRQYGGVCFEITHHAALLNFLGNAGAARAPQALQPIWDLPVSVAGLNAATVMTEADAEALGL